MKEGEDLKKDGGDRMKEEIKKMNVAQLKEVLKSYGLTVIGLRGDFQAQLNTHLLELEVVGDNGEGKADTMEEDTIPGWGGGRQSIAVVFFVEQKGATTGIISNSAIGSGEG